MRVLYITSFHRTGGWLAEAFAADSASDVLLEEAVGLAAGVSRLRDDVFDAVLVSHDPDQLDALELIEGVRGGGSDDPLIVLGDQCEEEMAPLCFEVGADGYVCVGNTTTRTLIWIVARAVERHQLLRENQRLALAQQQRLRQEQNEAERALEEQRAVIRDLETIRMAGASLETGVAKPAVPHQPSRPALALPERLVKVYREMLRAYVIMGTGNLGDEMNALADLLVTAGVTAQQTFELHLHALEDLLDGLGCRSTRHVLTRADLLVLELMVHLAEGYRRRYMERANPPRQRLLPGFETDDPQWLRHG